MIKYRYNLETDPEPGPHVKRLRAWSPGARYVHSWVRVPCWRSGYRTMRPEMDAMDRRHARRHDVSYRNASGARQHRPGTVMFLASNDHCSDDSHYHWTDGNKYRAWGPLRGATVAVDADAMRRLHSTKRRGWRR